MEEFKFNNGMKSVGLDMVKAGLVLTVLCFVICIIVFLFDGMDFIMTIGFSLLMLVIFSLLGGVFIIQQKDVLFNHSSLEIKYIYKSKVTVVELTKIEKVKIINIGNYQPKIVIKTNNWRYAFNCSNVVSNKDILSIKDYFETKSINTIYKDKGIRW